MNDAPDVPPLEAPRPRFTVPGCRLVQLRPAHNLLCTHHDAAGVKEVVWEKEHDALVLDPRTAAVLALGEMFLALAKFAHTGEPKPVPPITHQLVVDALAADAAAEGQ